MNIFWIVLVGVGAIVAIIFFRGKSVEKEPVKTKELPAGEASIFQKNDNKKLTSEEARQWLDEFLQEQQAG